MLVFALFGVIFSGLHCIDWNFAFKTDAERHLWRVTSLIITGISFIVAPIESIINLGLINLEAKGFKGFVRVGFNFFIGVAALHLRACKVLIPLTRTGIVAEAAAKCILLGGVDQIHSSYSMNILRCSHIKTSCNMHEW